MSDFGTVNFSGLTAFDYRMKLEEVGGPLRPWRAWLRVDWCAAWDFDRLSPNGFGVCTG